MQLVAQSLACRRAGRLVFSNVAFSLSGGEAVLLRGPNGSGKSSLLRMLAGLLPVEAGEARLDDVSLRGDREGFQQYLAYAGHLDAVKPQLTVAENLAIWARLYGAPLSVLVGVSAEPAVVPRDDEEDEPEAVKEPVRDRVALALERLGLQGIADFPAAYCSAGQKRRLGLARLLVVDRPVWLLDEPTVSLDVDAVETFASIVREHVEGGGLAIAATHVPLGLSHSQEIVMGEAHAPRQRDAWDDEPAADTLTLADDPFLEGDWR